MISQPAQNVQRLEMGHKNDVIACAILGIRSTFEIRLYGLLECPISLGANIAPSLHGSAVIRERCSLS